MPSGYELVHGFKCAVVGVRSWFGFVLRSADRVVLAFRGSRTFANLLGNLAAAQTEFPFVPGAGSTHSGFTSIYGSCRNEILSTLARLPNRLELLVTGHSMGGALATLAALDMAENTRFRGPVVYSYGSPRIGSPRFAATYDQRIRESVRVVNLLDSVPSRPPSQLRFPFSSQVWLYHHVQHAFPFAVAAGSPGRNHDIRTYLAALRQLTGPGGAHPCTPAK